MSTDGIQNDSIRSLPDSIKAKFQKPQGEIMYKTQALDKNEQVVSIAKKIRNGKITAEQAAKELVKLYPNLSIHEAAELLSKL